MPGIASIGWYIPPVRRTPAEIAAAYGVARAAVEQFGLRAQPVAGPDDHPTTMAARAVRAALQAAALSVADLDLLIFCGMTRDYPAPWVAAFGVLHELAARRATGFDLSNRCPGLQDALWLATQLVRAGTHRVVAVCSAERFDYLLGPQRTPRQLSDVCYSAGAAAALVTADAENEILAYSHFTHENLSLHMQNAPRAGGTRTPIAQSVQPELHLWQNDMTLTEVMALRRFLQDADRRNLDVIRRAADFAEIDFVITTALDVKAQSDALRSLGFDPERQTFFSLPHFGHIGGADTLLSLAAAIAQGYRVGPRLVLLSRSVVSSNALAIRAAQPDMGIRIVGSPLDPPPTADV